MRKKRVWMYLMVFIVGGIVLIGAERSWALEISDDLTLSGYVRTEFDIHTGVSNPNNAGLNDGNYKINLLRNTLYTEWDYKPSDNFKLCAKVKFVDDSTDRVDANLARYNSFPTFSGDGSMMRWGSNHDAFEASELYADISAGRLWLRIGRQQVVWGESLATRVLDVFNPLDLTQYFYIVPQIEEFQNIRIPLWALRATYLLPRIQYFNDLTVEGVLNPGNIIPEQLAKLGSPFNVVPYIPYLRYIEPQNRRGHPEVGGRIYGSVGNFGFSLNYLYTYDQEAIFKSVGLVPDPINGIPMLAPYGDSTLYSILLKNMYPKENIYGFSVNYFFEKLKTVTRCEFTYIPDEPYQSAINSSKITEAGTVKYALGLDRDTFIFPISVTPEAMSVSLQFVQSIREGDPRDLLYNNATVDKMDNQMSLFLIQNFWHEQFSLIFLYVYDFKNAYWVQPGVRYKPGNHWMFEVYANDLGGADKRSGHFGSLNFANGVLSRITYLF